MIQVVGDPNKCAKHGCELTLIRYMGSDELVKGCRKCHHSGSCPTHPQGGVWEHPDGARCATCGYWFDGREQPPPNPTQVRTFDNYSKLVARTDTKNFPLEYHAGCVCEEAGELFGKVKKIVYHKHPQDESALAAMIEEIGDVLWYLDRVANRLGTSLERAANQNIAKLRARYPQGFSEERSRNRHSLGVADTSQPIGPEGSGELPVSSSQATPQTAPPVNPFDPPLDEGGASEPECEYIVAGGGARRQPPCAECGSTNPHTHRPTDPTGKPYLRLTVPGAIYRADFEAAEVTRFMGRTGVEVTASDVAAFFNSLPWDELKKKFKHVEGNRVGVNHFMPMTHYDWDKAGRSIAWDEGTEESNE